MRNLRHAVVGLLPVALILWSAGCNQNTSNTGAPRERSAKVALQATGALPGAIVQPNNIPMTGGTLDVQSAMVNIDMFFIQENSGTNGEGGDTTRTASESDSLDITVAGPFVIEIAGGQVLVESVAVYPGTFKQLTASFGIATQSPFNGNSIVINATYTPSGGSGIPVILQSAYNRETECLIADGGITVPRDTTVALVAAFDVVGWFTGVDLAHAVVTNGQILIDNSHNTDLLAAFEANLENSGGDNGGQGGEH